MLAWLFFLFFFFFLFRRRPTQSRCGSTRLSLLRTNLAAISHSIDCHCIRLIKLRRRPTSLSNFDAPSEIAIYQKPSCDTYAVELILHRCLQALAGSHACALHSKKAPGSRPCEW
ncbi:hypothetical protein BJX66DRAFT_158844 [Aspergillus keveii]|jgi:hypothetical protein|uniref:Secreted protein n=1 Tax=Aspergillus keveii TaxID=714993 RepID=A0ABR4GA46_9EURO